MDRLHIIIAAALVCAMGCDGGKANAAAATPSRVNAVAVTKQAVEKPEDFCDVYRSPSAGGEPFGYPPLSADPPAPAAAGWQWVNVWATWCKPCIEEMPRLATWKTELAEFGLADVVFLSADDSDEIVSTFRAEHPEVPDSVRMSEAADLQPWLNDLGLDGSPSLPVHIFVDASRTTRCIRMGGVTDRDRDAVVELLKTK